jgi:hypothetical protein
VAILKLLLAKLKNKRLFDGAKTDFCLHFLPHSGAFSAEFFRCPFLFPGWFIPQLFSVTGEANKI